MTVLLYNEIDATLLMLIHCTHNWLVLTGNLFVVFVFLWVQDIHNYDTKLPKSNSFNEKPNKSKAL